MIIYLSNFRYKLAVFGGGGEGRLSVTIFTTQSALLTTTRSAQAFQVRPRSVHACHQALPAWLLYFSSVQPTHLPVSQYVICRALSHAVCHLVLFTYKLY